MTEAQKAAFRLACASAEAGKVRTITRGERAEVNPWSRMGDMARTRNAHKRGSNAKRSTGAGRGGNNRQAVSVDGVVYTSLGAARKGLGIGYQALYDLIDTGKASLIKGE